VDGALVYVQHGWVSKSLGIDPYAGLDLRGKIAVVSAYPGGVERWQDDRARGGDFVAPWDAAAQRGAIAQVEISGFGEWQPTVTPSTWLPDGTSLVASWMPQERALTPLPRIAVSRRVADALFLTERHSAIELISGAVRGESSPSFALNPNRDLQLAICTKARTDSSSARNVIAVVEGSDPVLKHEYIVIGAHYDGQGLQLPPVHSDSIMNSAEDNASGSAGLMQIARAFARGPHPKRSVIFAWFTWEEMSYGQARLGSKFFVSHPPVPLGAIKAMLNLDEIGLVPSDTAGVVILGFNANTALRDVALATNAAYLNVGFRSENWGDAARCFRPCPRLLANRASVVPKTYRHLLSIGVP
jgi:hypothetical protein